MRRSLWFALTLVAASCGAEDRAPRPDVVVLMLDTTRADHLGPFTDVDPTPTPFLDRLAARSIVFENAWTASTATAPSTASVFTGLTPPVHGVEYNLLANARPEGDESVSEFLSSIEVVALPTSVRTLTEHLSAAGYQTLGIGANPNFCRALGFSRGFDVFSEHSERDAKEMALELQKLSRELDPDRPTFTYLHYMDPHTPYTQRKPWCPHAEGKRCPPLCRYASEISFLDAELERVVDEMGWLENAIIVVVTDHGEEFRDHGDIMHRYSVYQELSRAGLLLHVPGLEAGRSSIPAHHVDLLPTILQLLDLPAPERTDGIALVPALAAEAGVERPLVTCRVGNGGRQLWGLTLGTWRLIEEQSTGAAELYDIGADPEEKRDLAGERPDVLADLRRRLERIRADLEPLPREEVTVDLSAHLSRVLTQLGYTGEDD